MVFVKKEKAENQKTRQTELTKNHRWQTSTAVGLESLLISGVLEGEKQ